MRLIIFFLFLSGLVFAGERSDDDNESLVSESLNLKEHIDSQKAFIKRRLDLKCIRASLNQKYLESCSIFGRRKIIALFKVKIEGWPKSVKCFDSKFWTINDAEEVKWYYFQA